jgi:hypothetical protein
MLTPNQGGTRPARDPSYVRCPGTQFCADSGTETTLCTFGALADPPFRLTPFIPQDWREEKVTNKKVYSKALNNHLVKLEERWQVGYWTTALRCTETALRDAMAAVGPEVAAVREHLATRKLDSSAVD